MTGQFDKIKRYLEQPAPPVPPEIETTLKHNLYECFKYGDINNDNPTESSYRGYLSLAYRDGAFRNLDLLLACFMYTNIYLDDANSMIAFEDAYKSRRTLSKTECFNLLNAFETVISGLKVDKRELLESATAESLEQKAVRTLSSKIVLLLEENAQLDDKSIQEKALKIRPDYFPVPEYLKLIGENVSRIREETGGVSQYAAVVDAITGELVQRNPISATEYKHQAQEIRKESEYFDTDITIAKFGKQCVIEMAEAAGYDLSKGRGRARGSEEKTD